MKLEQSEFDKITGYVSSMYGMKFGNHMHSTVEVRLKPRVKYHQFRGFDEYTQYLFSDKGLVEMRLVVDLLSTNETWFFREKPHFEWLSEYVKRDTSKNEAKIWSAACSSGREAYSIAMTIEESNLFRLLPFSYHIWGTDISSAMIRKAQSAEYEISERDEISTSRLSKFFEKNNQNNSWMVQNGLRSRLSFDEFNLTQPQGFLPLREQFQIIFCRNVLIYFHFEKQREVIKNLLTALAPGGFLILGHTETLMVQGIQSLTNVGPSIYKKED